MKDILINKVDFYLSWFKVEFVCSQAHKSIIKRFMTGLYWGILHDFLLTFGRIFKLIEIQSDEENTDID